MQLISSMLTPVVIVFLGYLANKRLKQFELRINQEREDR